MKIEIETEHLSMRTANLLQRAGVMYLEDLTELSFSQIRKWRNCGKKTINEIREYLGRRGLALKGEGITPEMKNFLIKALEYRNSDR